MTGNIIGYDLGESYCQISYYSDEHQEPQTIDTALDNFQIPLTVGELVRKAMLHEKVAVGEKMQEAVWILAKYIESSLQKFSEIRQIVFTVPQLNMDMVTMLKSIGQRVGVPKNRIYVQDYKESFCHYMLYQPKELWQYEAALFHCDRHEVKAYMLRKIRAGFGKGRDSFVTVEEVASARMKELEAIYPVLNVDRAKDADVCFKQFVQGVFNKKLVSSVFLVGEGFENDWYPQSLRVLCNGRKAFMGNNLYSKGACYTAYRKCLELEEGPVYLDESKMMDQICLKIRSEGVDKWQPIVFWGNRWYESDTQFEILLENTDDLELHIESLIDNEMQVEKISLDGLPKRGNYSLRLQVKVLFLDEKTCKITFRDMGFGEFFRASDFCVEKELHLGGSNGQYHSLS